MRAPVYWLGTAAVLPAVETTEPELPGSLAGALVIQPSPLSPARLWHLNELVTRRGGRLAIELGDMAPVGEGLASPFQFSRDAAGPEELRRQLLSVAADPSVFVPPRARFVFKKLEAVEPVACAAAALLPRPNTRIVGLIELLLNAVEHGNLGLPGDEKRRWLVSGMWMSELARRSTTAPWSERVVTVDVEADQQGFAVIITDEGEGFDHRRVVPQRSLSGRGLALARGLSFESIEYEGRGNIVVARISR